MRFVIIHVLAPGSALGLEAARTQAHALTGSAQALRYPPHITLRTGIVCPDDRAETVALDFLAHASRGAPARAWTAGLRCEEYTPGHGLIALEVRSDGSLEALHSHLLEFDAWAKGPQRSFHPHLTIAFDDLDRAQTQRLADYFAEPPHRLIDFEFTVDSVALYRETPQRWVEAGRTSL